MMVIHILLAFSGGCLFGMATMAVLAASRRDDDE